MSQLLAESGAAVSLVIVSCVAQAAIFFTIEYVHYMDCGTDGSSFVS